MTQFSLSMHAYGEDIEVLESFTYFGTVVHNNGRSDQEVIRRIGLAYGVMDSLNTSIWRCRYLCSRTKLCIFKTLVLPVLLYGCQTWTLTVTWRGVSMSLVPSAFAESWGTTGMTSRQTSDCFMKLSRGLLPA